MDAVGSILAERESERFPWGAGALLAAILHLGIAAAFLASSFARPIVLAAPRAVAVRILPAGSIRGLAQRAAPPEPARPRIEKPREEPPPPPSKHAALLPAKEEKKKPTPPPPSRATAPRAPDVSLPTSGEGQGGGSGVAQAGMGGKSGVGAMFDQAYFKNSDYPGRIGVIIGLNWFKPADKVPVNPVIRFRIQRDGTVTDVQIERSSGLPFVDRAAARAVIASSPLPPLPADYPGSYAGAAFEFE